MSQIPYNGLQERIYQMFLPEIREIKALGFLRQPEINIEPFGDHLNEYVVAAAIYGVAKRAGLSITAIKSNSPEEFALRKALRGKFFDSEREGISRMSLDQVMGELEEEGISREDVRALGQELREMEDFYGSLGAEDDADEDPPEPESTAPTAEYQVTKIEALFLIEDNQMNNVGTYCRAHTPQGNSDALFFWDSDDFDEGSPYDSTNYRVEFEAICDPESYEVFLAAVVSDILSIQDEDTEENIDSMIARLEFELDSRSSLP